MKYIIYMVFCIFARTNIDGLYSHYSVTFARSKRVVSVLLLDQIDMVVCNIARTSRDGIL